MLAAVLLTAAALTGISAAPAAAADPSPGPEVATSGGPDFTAAGMCNIYRGAYRGGMLCGGAYRSQDYTHPDGRKETFIIGYDQAMWHIYQRYPGDASWSGWSSMGGGFLSGANLLKPDPLIVYGNGLDNEPYCKTYKPPWTGWYRCFG
ncbi:hypothetical protein [Asanoa iriomotensis]|uniref:PLL-like beta propeller domain-containing protein n=1 Tax=Asanoa iriomotensis TaxID=234613 RepID=A0ABQ4BYV3_9ACTN|nr:hypothetical protein [Asanoa iriomotensis]GIF55712.1 hypothetical protein Air01nite_18070 [Asanoa iriomotensis]